MSQITGYDITVVKPLDYWRGLADKADAFFEQAHQRYSQHFACAPGCSDCCRSGLSVLLPEAVAIVEALELRPLTGESTSGRCALLRNDRCAIYDARPLRCRTHGLPILQVEQDDAQVSCCELNFVDVQTLPKDAVLDEAALLAGLVMVDAMMRRTIGLDQAHRYPLADLAENGWRALPEALRA